jgi:hypothetical protein
LALARSKRGGSGEVAFNTKTHAIMRRRSVANQRCETKQFSSKKSGLFAQPALKLNQRENSIGDRA